MEDSAEEAPLTLSQLKADISANFGIDVSPAELGQIAGEQCLFLPIRQEERIPYFDPEAAESLIRVAAVEGFDVKLHTEKLRPTDSELVQQVKLRLGLCTDVAERGDKVVVRVREKPALRSKASEENYPPLPSLQTRKDVYESYGVWIMPQPEDEDDNIDECEGMNVEEEEALSRKEMEGFLVWNDESDGGSFLPEQTEAEEVADLRMEAERFGACLDGPRPKRRALLKATERLRSYSVEEDANDDSDVSMSESDGEFE